MGRRASTPRERSSGKLLRVGIDTGGTFTDLVAHGPGLHVAFKVPSTPADPSRAVLHALDELRRRVPDLPERLAVVHGSTVATNCLLEGQGARVVLVTNAGFEDLIEIGRQQRQDLYALNPSRPLPLVARQDRVGVPERTRADGHRDRIPSEGDLGHLLSQVARRRPEAIAIGLLHSYRNPAAERQLEKALRGLGVPLCRSSDVAPRFREYERFSTTVANAALLPVLQGYLERLRRRLPRTDLSVLQSSGGMTSLREASRYPVRLVLSGPAGGLHAAERAAAQARLPPLVTFDMGGTSTDVGLVREGAGRTDQLDLEGRPLLVESMDLETIGAGGGSLLWRDAAGSLRVGPRSAGADPGPACYGRGQLPTVTDAHLVLGRLPLLDKLGGTIELQPKRAQRALQGLAHEFKTEAVLLAEAALTVADAAMERAIKAMTLERGHDPRAMALFSFGGAGGLHACRLAQRLGIREVLIPPTPGAVSAFGMAVCEARLDLVEGVVQKLDARSEPALRRRGERLLARAKRRFEREMGAVAQQACLDLSCRYAGQSHELRVPFRRDWARRFEDLHEQRFGFRLAGQPREVVALHATVLRPGPARPLGPQRKLPRRAPAWQGAVRGTAEMWIVSGKRGSRQRPRPRSVPVLERSRLEPGCRVPGPAVVVEETATTILELGFEARVDGHGFLRLRESGSQRSGRK